MRAAFNNFSQILDNHWDDLKKRPHGYRERLAKEYLERFPEATPLTMNQMNYFLSTYRMTHDIPREYGPNYPYHQAWEERAANGTAKQRKVYPRVMNRPK
jgi:hypothetical protein